MRTFSPEDVAPTPVQAAQLVKAAAWDGRRLQGVGAQVFARARALARRHLVETRVMQIYPEQLAAAELEEEARRAREFAANLGAAGERLHRVGLQGVLIKSGWESEGPEGSAASLALEYGDFDLVVGRRHLAQAIDALSGWGVPERAPRLEPHKVTVRFPTGPSAHLHGEAEWFGVPVITASSLLVRSRTLGALPGLLLPGAADALRVWVAHAAFQNLAFLLAELLQIRSLASPSVVAEALEMAGREGWKPGFEHALSAAKVAIGRLDAGMDASQSFGVGLRGDLSLVDGWRHSAHLVSVHGWGEGLRAAALRPALVLAKRRRKA